MQSFISSNQPAAGADGAAPVDIAAELASVQVTIQRLAERTPYGVKPKACIVPDDTAQGALWRWEVVNASLLAPADHSVIVSERKLLKQAGMQVKCSDAAIVLVQGKKDEARVSEQSEKALKALRQEELLVQKHIALLAKLQVRCGDDRGVRGASRLGDEDGLRSLARMTPCLSCCRVGSVVTSQFSCCLCKLLLSL